MKDISLIPNESTHFGFKDSRGQVINLEDMELYKQDKLGLKKMKEEGKLIMLEAPMEHLELNEQWFRENLLDILKETGS